jgi:DNA-binding NarL/FixJ family response regulator
VSSGFPLDKSLDVWLSFSGGLEQSFGRNVSRDRLTSREVDVLKLVAGGLTNREIAERLGTSFRTIDAHLRSIYGKIEVPSRAAATRYAVELGLV